MLLIRLQIIYDTYILSGIFVLKLKTEINDSVIMIFSHNVCVHTRILFTIQSTYYLKK